MSFDIVGIDFTRNDRPPRHIILTDWEARLVEHCLGRYIEAAVACEDATTGLATSAFGKVTSGKVPETVSLTERATARRREAKIIREMLDPTVGTREIEGKWAGFAFDLAEAVEAADPDMLDRIMLSRGDDDHGVTATAWLGYRRAKDAAKAERATA